MRAWSCLIFAVFGSQNLKKINCLICCAEFFKYERAMTNRLINNYLQIIATGVCNKIDLINRQKDSFCIAKGLLLAYDKALVGG